MGYTSLFSHRARQLPYSSCQGDSPSFPRPSIGAGELSRCDKGMGTHGGCFQWIELLCGMSHRMFHPQTSRAEGSRGAVRPVCPFFHSSAIGSPSARPDQSLQACPQGHTFLDRLPSQRCEHSLGGVVAQWLARRIPVPKAACSTRANLMAVYFCSSWVSLLCR